MADLTTLSDDELQQLAASARNQPAPGPLDLSQMSDAELSAAREQAIKAPPLSAHPVSDEALELGKAFVGGASPVGRPFAAEQDDHPYASMAGTGTGMAALGGIAGAVARGAESIPYVGRAIGVFGRAVSPVKGQTGLNIVKSIGLNAGIGGGASLAQGDDLATAGRNAAIAGAVGPVAQAATSYVAPRVLSANKAAWAVLAKKLDEKPGVIANAVSTHQYLTGEMPSMAEIVNYHSQGQLSALADANSIIGDAALKAKRAGSAPLAAQIAATSSANQPQTIDGLQQWRNMRMDNAVAPVRNNIVALSPHEMEQLSHPKIIDAYDGRLHNGMATGTYDPFTDVAGQHNGVMVAAANNMPSGAMSVGALDTIRQGLAGKVREGADAATYTTLRNNVGNIAEKDKGFKAAMDTYRSDSQYMDGFKEGRGGDAATQGTLGSPAAVEGYEHGNALHRAEQALRTIAPGSVAPDGMNTGRAAQLATAGANAIHGSGWTLPHLIRSMPGVRLSPRVQNVIADQLFSKDPAVVAQAVRNLKRGGGTNETINRVATAMGGAVSVNIAKALQGDTGAQ